MPISTPPLNCSPAIGGESAFTYCMVCGSSFSQCDGYDVGRPAPARIHGFMTDAAGCEPHRPSGKSLLHCDRTRLVIIIKSADN